MGRWGIWVGGVYMGRWRTSIPECLQFISGSTPMYDQLRKDGGKDVSAFTFRHIYTNQSLICFV
jgi:hypothetical protein